MLKQVLKKIKNKKWLSLCLVLGLTFLIATLSCHPMFKAGSLDKLLNRYFEQYIETENKYPTVLSEEDYVMVQRAFGSGMGTILLRHVSKNVLLPMITKLGMALPMLVTGAVITETVFAWPGIGVYFTTAIRNLDYPVVMAVLVLSGSLVILGNLVADCLYSLLDPRIRKEV